MTDTIKAIFTNLLFVIGVILLIIGSGQATATAVKLIVFDQYPLNTWEEQQCDEASIRISTPTYKPDEPSQMDSDTLAKSIESCNQRLERVRKLKLVEDTTWAIVMLVSGLVLTISFKRFIFSK